MQPAAAPATLIDAQMPVYDVHGVHALRVPASCERVFPLIERLDFSGSPLIRTLFALRGLPAASLRMDGMHKVGFRVLAVAPGEEMVLGLIGRFWRLRERPLRFEPDDFAGFDEPGYARAAWNFQLLPTSSGACIVSTETRVHCTDVASRARFLRYWRIIRPFSGLIRMEILRGLRRSAVRAATSS